jgi:hypothetical protein
MLSYFGPWGLHTAQDSSYAFFEVDNELLFRDARDSDADVLKQVNGHRSRCPAWTSTMKVANRSVLGGIFPRSHARSLSSNPTHSYDCCCFWMDSSCPLDRAQSQRHFRLDLAIREWLDEAAEAKVMLT